MGCQRLESGRDDDEESIMNIIDASHASIFTWSPLVHVAHGAGADPQAPCPG
jgi:hypothetical protein